MSQVIVTNDNLNEKRELTRAQEHKIKVEQAFASWRRSDATKTDAFQRFLVLIVGPILALWAGLASLATGVIWLIRSLFRLFGAL